MAINEHVISVSDPGAVPGASTISNSRQAVVLWGRTRIDERVKVFLLLGMVPPLSGQTISANDNTVALAA